MIDTSDTPIQDVKELIQFLEAGKTVEYLFFWGHQPEKSGDITRSCLSNWFESPFVVAGVTYPTSEHYMMAQKALLFNDQPIYQEILQAPTPKDAKELGRKVHGYDDATWDAHRKRIVTDGVREKFSQHPGLKQFLLSTQNRVLVEASPYDRIWGIGMSASQPNVEDPRSWKGQNLLGFVLMDVRRGLRIA